MTDVEKLLKQAVFQLQRIACALESQSAGLTEDLWSPCMVCGCRLRTNDGTTCWACGTANQRSYGE